MTKKEPIKTVETILKDYLTQNGYDGLFFPGECACLKEDLEPCGHLNKDCQPGYRVESTNPDDDCDWYIQPNRPEFKIQMFAKWNSDVPSWGTVSLYHDEKTAIWRLGLWKKSNPDDDFRLLKLEHKSE